MKCSDCNQQIIDNKTFCPNCGKQLKKISNETKKGRIFLVFVVIMLALGIFTIYIVGNYGTEKELNKILKHKKENIEDFYGSYIIKDILINSNTPENLKNYKDNIIGYELELTKEKFKFGLYKIEWIKINKPTVLKVKDVKEHQKKLNTTNENINVISIEGLNVNYKDNVNYENNKFLYMVSVDSKVYLYYMGTYFELESSKLGYKSVDTYYKVILPKLIYPSSVNDLLKKHIENTKNFIENEDYNKKYVLVYENYIEEYKDNDITHLIFVTNAGYIDAGMDIDIKVLNFNKKGKSLNLKEYIELINKDYGEVVNKIKISQNLSLEEIPNFIKYELTSDLMYYKKDNTLFVATGYDDFGVIFVEIKV